MKTRKFIDSVSIHVKAGSGGNGSASFRREKFVPKGGPDGGDGGRGGHVILKADDDEDSLVQLFFKPIRKAESAGNGEGGRRAGRCGKDLIIKIPCGTEVWNKEDDSLIADIVEHDQEVRIAKGGIGGKGNCHWKTSTNQAPLEHSKGEPGEEFDFRLELKLVSDAGLAGFPNAGKSSLISKMSDAHPKVAPYPFTTLNPIMGTLIFEDYTRMKVADVPGLIKGAHDGVGLGHNFLRHMERSRFIIYVIDMAGVDGRKPYEDYTNLQEELRLYREDLIRRPSLIVANKMDLPEAKDNLKEFIKETKETPLEVSAETGMGIPELRAALHELCSKYPVKD